MLFPIRPIPKNKNNYNFKITYQNTNRPSEQRLSNKYNYYNKRFEISPKSPFIQNQISVPFNHKPDFHHYRYILITRVHSSNLNSVIPNALTIVPRSKFTPSSRYAHSKHHVSCFQIKTHMQILTHTTTLNADGVRTITLIRSLSG